VIRKIFSKFSQEEIFFLYRWFSDLFSFESLSKNYLSPLLTLHSLEKYQQSAEKIFVNKTKVKLFQQFLI
jgi:hypothetical protein